MLLREVHDKKDALDLGIGQQVKFEMIDQSNMFTAVVVNWNAGVHLASCVRSLLSQVDVTLNVVVVDNASSDNSLTELAEFGDRVQIIQTCENLGFGRGVNRGVFATATPYVLVLNPDVVLEPHAVSHMMAFLSQNPKVGLVGPRLKDTDGEVRASCGWAPRLVDEICRKFLLHLVFPLFKFRRTRPPKATAVDWVTGACFATRREVFETLGGFDEAIFMYYEDVDLGLRVQSVGWDVWYLPEAVGTHVGGESSKQALTRMLVVSEASYVYLTGKHLGRWAAFLLVCLRPVEMILRSVLWGTVYLLQPRRRDEARARLRAYFMILTGGVAKEAV